MEEEQNKLVINKWVRKWEDRRRADGKKGQVGGGSCSSLSSLIFFSCFALAKEVISAGSAPGLAHGLLEGSGRRLGTSELLFIA
jgi:hypothetical protein